MAELNLCSITAEILERLRSQLNAAQCATIFSHDEDIPLLRGDRLRLEQVLTNLLTNAIRYAPGSKIEVEVRFRNDTLTLSVRDEGPGISQEDQARIFSRFERCGNGHVGGLGLGLYISKQIVEGHGGKIRVESEPGKGAKFIVSFPLESLVEKDISPRIAPVA